MDRIDYLPENIPTFYSRRGYVFSEVGMEEESSVTLLATTKILPKPRIQSHYFNRASRDIKTRIGNGTIFRLIDPTQLRKYH